MQARQEQGGGGVIGAIANAGEAMRTHQPDLAQLGWGITKFVGDLPIPAIKQVVGYGTGARFVMKLTEAAEMAQGQRQG